MRKKTKNARGITLIALIITVIVMLILAGVALSAISGDAGLFGRVQKTAELYNNQAKNEADAVNSIIDEINKYYNDDDENTGDVEVTVKVGEGTKTLKKGDEKDLLGKKVMNFKTNSGGTEEITIGSETYTVSTTYRLYYVDFDGKYGEKGTIYLKADHPSLNTKYSLCLDDSLADDSNVKIKDLNPGLYYEESEEEIPLPNKDEERETADIPSSDNNNMKAVTWLTNTKNWESLKNNVNSEVKDSINYIVGAPSLEMMIDSYNTHYGLSGKTPDTGTELEGTDNRVKLFYKYPCGTELGKDGNYGYGVGPGDIDEYSTITKDYTVKTDTKIDSMYSPGDQKFYLLASPSANDSDAVMFAGNLIGGCAYIYDDYGDDALCPLVSLKSSVQLELTE